MDDLYRKGFAGLLADTPSPPLLDDLHPTRAAVPDEHRRAPRSVGLAFTILGAAVLIALPLVIFIGDDEPGTPAGDEMVPYVRLTWEVTADRDCGPLSPVTDNGGFESAVIEIWGPTVDGLIRVDATAPDGRVERTVFEGLLPHEPIERLDDPPVYRGWFTHTWDLLFPDPEAQDEGAFERTAFRVLHCGDQQVANGLPIGLVGGPTLWFVGFPDSGITGLAVQRGAFGEAEPGRWRGSEVTVFRDRAEGSSTEYWIDERERRWERAVWEWRRDARGLTVTTMEVVDRAEVPASEVSFHTDGLYLVQPQTGWGEIGEWVEYARLEWSYEVVVECDPEFDNEGFGSAVIEIYGPSSDGFMRYDATAPDGTVETFVTRGWVPGAVPPEDWPSQIWTNVDGPVPISSVFRIAWCTTWRTPTFSESHTVADPPFPSGMPHFFNDFMALRGVPGDPDTVRYFEVFLPSAGLVEEIGTDRDTSWRGRELSVYRGGSEHGYSERWYDRERHRLERTISHVETPGIGVRTERIDVVARWIQWVDSTWFSVDGLNVRFDADADADAEP